MNSISQDKLTPADGSVRAGKFTRREFVGIAGCAAAALAAVAAGISAGTRQPGADGVALADEGATRVVTNVDGTEITIPDEITSVAAIFGPSYEKIVACGAEDRITCCGDFHHTGWPWSNVIYQYLNDIPGIENAHSDLNVEDLVAQGVQVVFSFPNPNQTEAINNAGLVAIPYASTGAFRDLVSTMNLYADVFNDDTAHEQAQKYEQYFDEKVDMVQQRTQDLGDEDRPGVYLAYTDMLHGYGSQSDMVEVIDLAGGVLVSKDVDGGSNIEITSEQILEWDPDYIFVSHAGSSGNATAETAIEEALGTGDFDNVSAVINDHVYATPEGVFFWDAGIQKILYLIYLAKTMHPDLFEDIDLKEELKEFYSEFYFYDLTDQQAQDILDRKDPDTEETADSAASDGSSVADAEAASSADVSSAA